MYIPGEVEEAHVYVRGIIPGNILGRRCVSLRRVGGGLIGRCLCPCVHVCARVCVCVCVCLCVCACVSVKMRERAQRHYTDIPDK